jgi:hypothetical protein
VWTRITLGFGAPSRAQVTAGRTSSRAILSSCGPRAEAISANEIEGRLCPIPLDPGPR